MKKLFKNIIKDGKVFGKYNIIDFLLVTVIVVGVITGGTAIAKKFIENYNRRNADVVIMKFYTEEISDFVAEKLAVGSSLLDDDKKVALGIATNIEINDSVTYGGISDGQYELVNKEGYKSAIITAEVDGEKNDLGAIVDGVQYGVGHSMTLRVGDAKIYLRVYDIGIKSEIEKTEKQEADKKKSVLVSFEANEANNISVNSLEVGDKLYDTTNGVELGSIVSFEVSDAKVFITTADGKVIISPKEGYSTVKIVAEVSGELLENGTVTIDSKDYYLAKEFQLRAGNAIIGCTLVTDIRLK